MSYDVFCDYTYVLEDKETPIRKTLSFYLKVNVF